MHLYIPPVLYFICYSLFLYLWASFWDHFLPEGHPLRQATPWDGWKLCIVVFTKKCSDRETQPILLASLQKGKISLQKDSCLLLSLHSHSPTWAHHSFNWWVKTYFEELWHRPSHAVITETKQLLKMRFHFFEEAVRCIIIPFLPDTWFCWLSDDLLQDTEHLQWHLILLSCQWLAQDTSITKILSSLAMTHKLLLSDPLNPLYENKFHLMRQMWTSWLFPNL